MIDDKTPAESTAAANGGTNLPARQPEWGSSPGLGPILSSFDVSTPEGRIGLFNAISGESQKANDWLNSEIEIVNVAQHAVAFEGEGGELVNATRTVLILKGGEQVHFVARSIDKSVHLIAFAFGPPPWPHGLKCRLTQEDLGNGKRWYKLTPIIQGKVKK